MMFSNCIKFNYIGNLIVLCLALQLTGCNNSAVSSNSSDADNTRDSSKVTVNWTAPVARTDDAPLSLSDIAGYRVYYGKASGDYSNKLDINDNTAEEASVAVTSGLNYFVVTCLDTTGHESVYSEELMISI